MLTVQIIIPDFAAFTEIITSIFEEVALIDEGEVASYIPQLAMVDRNKFAVAVTTIDGQRFSIGDSEDLFCLQSSCKPVTYAIALQQHGEDKVHSVRTNPGTAGARETTLPGQQDIVLAPRAGLRARLLHCATQGWRHCSQQSAGIVSAPMC